MRFIPGPLKGAFLIAQEPREDSRGFFARAFCRQEFAKAGLVSDFVQANNSLSLRAGTLRGLHYQLPPAAEVKLIRAVRGALFDFIVDIRPDSPTFKKWWGAELTDENRLTMYAPAGFAHALLTLKDNTEAIYWVNSEYSPQNERGIRYNDPALAISLPIEPIEVSDKDRAWPDLDSEFHGLERLRGLVG